MSDILGRAMTPGVRDVEECGQSSRVERFVCAEPDFCSDRGGKGLAFALEPVLESGRLHSPLVKVGVAHEGRWGG
jgi:hypothetical protein